MFISASLILLKLLDNMHIATSAKKDTEPHAIMKRFFNNLFGKKKDSDDKPTVVQVSLVTKKEYYRSDLHRNFKFLVLGTARGSSLSPWTFLVGNTG